MGIPYYDLFGDSLHTAEFEYQGSCDGETSQSDEFGGTGSTSARYRWFGAHGVEHAAPDCSSSFLFRTQGTLPR